MKTRGASLSVGAKPGTGGGGGSGNATSLRGKALATGVGSPTLGQLLTYTSGGDYGLTPFPNLPGQLYYWHQANGNWALTGEPSAGQYLGVSGGLPAWINRHSASSQSIAGTGAISVTVTTDALTLFGTLTGHRQVTLSASAGRRIDLSNISDGPYLTEINGPSGGRCYLGPGQSKAVWINASGKLDSDDLGAYLARIDVPMAGKAGGTAFDLVALPALFTLDLFEVLEVAAVTLSGGVGGLQLNAGVTLSGTTSLYDDILTASPLATLNTLHGWDKTKLGTAMATNGYAYLAAASTLKLHPSGPVSATGGTLRAFLRGRYLG